MSADNGIYILKTKDQYRVIHAQAIENLSWSHIKCKTVQGFVPTRIVEYFGETKYTRDKAKALLIASSMAKKCYILEYGISIIEVDKTWNQIIKEAKELAREEIAVVKKYLNVDGNISWKHDLENLERILGM